MALISVLINGSLLLFLIGYPVLNFFHARGDGKKNWFYLLICTLFYVFNKLPVLLKNKPIDPDEAFNLAEGLALIHVDPVLWRSVDFFTIGPLHILHFIVPHFLGFSDDFVNARIVWVFISLLTSFFLFKALGHAFNSAVRGMAFLYPFLFFAFGNNSSFNHFNNEASSILLMSAGMFILFKKKKDQDVDFGYDGAFYFLMGMVPYCKLQSAPLAVTLVACFFIMRIENFGSQKIRYILKTFICGILPSLILGIYLLYFGQFSNFVNFYLFSNLSYGDDVSIFSKVITTFLVRGVSEFPVNYFLKHFYILIFILVLIVAIVRKFRDKKTNIITVLFLVTIYSVAKPGYSFGHYFTYLYLTMPFGLGILWKEVGELSRKKMYFFVVSYVVLTVVLCFYHINLYVSTGTYDDLVQKMKNFGSSEVERSKAADELIVLKNKLHLQPTMTIFDWYPQIYIESGIFQGTHQNIPERLFGFQASEKEVTDFSRKVFLEDLKKNRPEFILVAITTDRSYYDYRYSNFHLLPEIKAYFDANYFFYKTSDNTDIFIRNDLRSRLKL